MPSDVILIDSSAGIETPRDLRDDESVDTEERLRRALAREKALKSYIKQQREEIVEWLKVKEERWSDVLEQIAAEGGACSKCEGLSGGKRGIVPALHLNNLNNFLAAASPGQLTASSVSTNSTRSMSERGNTSIRVPGSSNPFVPPCVPSLQLKGALTQISSRSLSGRMETPSSLSSDRTVPDRSTPIIDDTHSPHDMVGIIDSQRDSSRSGRRVTPTTPCQVTMRVAIPSLRLGTLKNKNNEVPVYINQLSNRSSSLSPSSRQASPAFQKSGCEVLSERSQSRSGESARTIDSCSNRD